MGHQLANPLNRPLGLILQAAIFNAVLVTVIAAVVIALLSGAAVEVRVVTAGSGVGQKMARTTSWHPFELAKAVLWLCPLTAITCGSFGFIAGLAGGSLMYLRARRLRSMKRLTTESGILGFLLACLFPWFDVWTGQAQGIRDLGYSGADLLLAPVLGCLCALICALFYRTRYFAAAKANAPSSAAR